MNFKNLDDLSCSELHSDQSLLGDQQLFQILLYGMERIYDIIYLKISDKF